MVAKAPFHTGKEPVVACSGAAAKLKRSTAGARRAWRAGDRPGRTLGAIITASERGRGQGGKGIEPSETVFGARFHAAEFRLNGNKRPSRVAAGIWRRSWLRFHSLLHTIDWIRWIDLTGLGLLRVEVASRACSAEELLSHHA